MKIRFQADADLSEDIVLGLIRLEPQIDFRTANEAGLRGLSDLEVLSVGARDNRILVSHDRRTMPTHFAAFVENSTSPGVFIVGKTINTIATMVTRARPPLSFSLVASEMKV